MRLVTDSLSRSPRAVALIVGAAGVSLSATVYLSQSLSGLAAAVLGAYALVCAALLLVLGGAVSVTLLVYQWVPRVLARPIAGERFAVHPSVLDKRTILGAALFGVGWGLCGVCPGPAVAGLGTGNWPLLVALAGLFAGGWLQGRFFGKA